MIYILTRAGKGREISEDAVLVGNRVYTDAADAAVVPEEGFICVADGVGGNNGGEVASSFILNALPECISINNSVLRDSLREINRQLIRAGNQDNRLNRMASTLSGICIKDGEVKLVHVGNTRVYAMQGHYLKLLTSDHTVYNWLKSAGRIDDAMSCNKNAITNCFGGGDETLINKLQITSVNPSKTFLITSDGIHDYLSIDKLEDILNSDMPADEKCAAISESALEAGSEDDMTAVLICM